MQSLLLSLLSLLLPTLTLALPAPLPAADPYQGTVPPSVNTSLSSSNGDDSCAPPEVETLPETWQCANTLQAMETDVDIRTFRPADMPKQYLTGKCFLIIAFVGPQQEETTSFLEWQIAGTHLLSSCQRNAGGIRVLPRSGGTLQMKESHKMQIIMSKPPRGKHSGNLKEPLSEEQWGQVFGNLRGEFDPDLEGDGRPAQAGLVPGGTFSVNTA